MFIKWSPNDHKSLVFVCILRAHNLKREMANVMAEPPESGKRRFNEAQQKRLKPTQQPEENEWKRARNHQNAQWAAGCICSIQWTPTSRGKEIINKHKRPHLVQNGWSAENKRPAIKKEALKFNESSWRKWAESADRIKHSDPPPRTPQTII